MGQEKKQVLHFAKKPLANHAKIASYNDINASFRPSEAQMDEAELRVAVARIILNGTYEERRHSSKDRAYRNISDEDIQSCLNGLFKLLTVEEGEDARGRDCWKYKITGRDLDGEELSLVLIVSREMQKITIITKF